MVFEAHSIRFLTVPVSECYTLEQILLSVLITAVCIKNVGWYSKHNPTLCEEYQPQFTRPYFFFFFFYALFRLLEALEAATFLFRWRNDECHSLNTNYPWQKCLLKNLHACPGMKYGNILNWIIFPNFGA